jgi:NAD(P)-dependent dehydrogenase (short-subunit alcohol dehydrogenase family)
VGDATLMGRHAIVTGGGHGLGAAIAHVLAAQGATLTIMGRNQRQMRETANAIAAAHKQPVDTCECDVTSPTGVERAFALTRELSGDTYILVNNAGIAEAAAFLDTSLDLWNRTLAVNLTGAFLCMQAALPGMIAARAGRIINIASTAGLKGYARIAAYCASKHGLVGLTRALAAEVARQNITVNAVCPAYTEGEMSQRAAESIAQARNLSAEEARQRMERLIPIRRLIRPQEVAHTVAWLCSEDAAAITGQAIAVAGGEVT